MLSLMLGSTRLEIAMQSRYLVPALSIALGLSGCSSPASNDPSGAIGGTSTSAASTTASTGVTGGRSSTTSGGTSANLGGTDPGTTAGGTRATGGSHLTGGSVAAGGSVATGGKSSGTGGMTGGASGGGSTRTGGSAATGGAKSTGGLSSTGGSVTSGGASGSGGTQSLGGSSANDTGGSSSVGGTSSLGGTSSTAGSSTGGSTGTVLNGCTAAISDEILDEEYAKWKAAYVRDCPPDQSRVQAGGSAPGAESSETFSEGIGYGMLLAVSFNDKETFQKLWAYYKAARNTHGLMNWKMNACTGNYYDANGASDGDLDTAMALVMGDRLWGGFGTDANDLINAIREFETMSCSGQTVLRPGDAWGLECTTGSLNPSYFSPAYYRAFAVYQPSEASFWNEFADASVKMLLAYQDTTDGGALMGEWSYVDRLADKNYGYNACRTPWRVAMDYVWWGTADSKTYLANVSAYVDSKGGIGSVPFDRNSAFLGPFALSGIATEKCEAYYQAWMTSAQYDDRYFQGTLRVLNLLLMAGKFTF